MDELIYGLLDGPMDAPGYYATGWLILALVGFSMMIVEAIRNNTSRAWHIGLLIAGIAYAAVNIGVFILTLLADAFAIFESPYIISATFVGPALMIIALIAVARSRKHLSWLSIAGCAIWVGCVAFAHLFAVAAVAASV